MQRKLLTSVALVGSLIGLSACGATGAGDSEPTTASTAGKWAKSVMKTYSQCTPASVQPKPKAHPISVARLTDGLMPT